MENAPVRAQWRAQYLMSALLGPALAAADVPGGNPDVDPAAATAAAAAAAAAAATETGTAAADAGSDAVAPARPFVLVPLIDVDPNSGASFGVIPTWLHTDGDQQIRQIVAPDVNHSPNFGFGGHARMLSYPSEDTQWSIVAGGQQRVERLFDYEVQTGRLRNTLWAFDASVSYDREGTPRFFGIGNRTPENHETNYTAQQRLLRASLRLNLDHELQLAYTIRVRGFDVLPGALDGVDSIETRFPHVTGLGNINEILHRVQLSYDTRDDSTVPRRGAAWTAYGGFASAEGVLGSALYREIGLDWRELWSPGARDTIAAHVATRYLAGDANVPFWALSALGGDQSEPGDSMPLRGFGTGRYYDRDAFVTNLEYRRKVLALDILATHIDVELTPFVDVGDAFAGSRTSPVRDLHHVVGLGFRGIARPFIVGYVDFGYGSQGVAAFTGINYPF
jgi:hypothetical protein